MPAPKKLTPAEWLQLIIEKAPELRAAGVTSIDLDGVCVELAPQEPAVDLASWRGIQESADELSHPLNDPGTYGLPPGSALPGYVLVDDWKDEQ